MSELRPLLIEAVAKKAPLCRLTFLHKTDKSSSMLRAGSADLETAVLSDRIGSEVRGRRLFEDSYVGPYREEMEEHFVENAMPACSIACCALSLSTPSPDEPASAIWEEFSKARNSGADRSFASAKRDSPLGARNLSRSHQGGKRRLTSRSSAGKARSSSRNVRETGAGEAIRTPDPNLGNLDNGFRRSTPKRFVVL